MRTDKQIKAVLFDFDDTLIDWSLAKHSWTEHNRPRWDNIHSYLRNEGHPLPSTDEFAHIVQSNMRRVWEIALPTWAGASFIEALYNAFDEMGIPPERIDMNEILLQYNWQPVPGVAPFPDAHAVLTELKARGYKIGLITNAFQPMWMRDVELNAFDLMKYLDARITSGDTRFMKPHPAIYWRMLGLLDLMPEDAIFVGDRPNQDILGAQNVGMLNVFMSPPHLNREMEGIIPNYTIEALSELLPILDSLES